MLIYRSRIVLIKAMNHILLLVSLSYLFTCLVALLVIFFVKLNKVQRKVVEPIECRQALVILLLLLLEALEAIHARLLIDLLLHDLAINLHLGLTRLKDERVLLIKITR